MNKLGKTMMRGMALYGVANLDGKVQKEIIDDVLNESNR